MIFRIKKGTACTCMRWQEHEMKYSDIFRSNVQCFSLEVGPIVTTMQYSVWPKISPVIGGP